MNMDEKTGLNRGEINLLVVGCIRTGDPGAAVEAARLGCAPELLNDVIQLCCSAGANDLAKEAAALREEHLKEEAERNEAIKELQSLYASRKKLKSIIMAEELRDSEVSIEIIKALLSSLKKK